MPYKLTSAQWRQLQPYVSTRARRGRPPADARKTLEAVVYVLSSGCRWDELPPEMGRAAPGDGQPCDGMAALAQMEGRRNSGHHQGRRARSACGTA